MAHISDLVSELADTPKGKAGLDGRLHVPLTGGLRFPRIAEKYGLEAVTVLNYHSPLTHRNIPMVRLTFPLWGKNDIPDMIAVYAELKGRYKASDAHFSTPASDGYTELHVHYGRFGFFKSLHHGLGKFITTSGIGRHKIVVDAVRTFERLIEPHMASVYAYTDRTMEFSLENAVKPEKWHDVPGAVDYLARTLFLWNPPEQATAVADAKA